MQSNELNIVLEKINKADSFPLEKPVFSFKKDVQDFINYAFPVLFPAYYTYKNYSQFECICKLKEVLRAIFEYEFPGEENTERIDAFLETLPSIKKSLLTDLDAIYKGDPAAKNYKEILLCYPGFYAIFLYRFAHALYKMKLVYTPRMISEIAHFKTGIDIHPGARIEEYFCIDHGTGIVIGETAILGKHVKIYQGVTIGAKSFEKDINGELVRNTKRHPTIEDYVTIYANATILGGNTLIGHNSIIGGNAWITHSIPPYSKIYSNVKESS